MIISLIKEQLGSEYVKEMEQTYGSIEEAEKLLKRTQPRNMVIYVDIESWKYYKNISKKLVHKSVFKNKYIIIVIRCYIV